MRDAVSHSLKDLLTGLFKCQYPNTAFHILNFYLIRGWNHVLLILWLSIVGYIFQKGSSMGSLSVGLTCYCSTPPPINWQQIRIFIHLIAQFCPNQTKPEPWLLRLTSQSLVKCRCNEAVVNFIEANCICRRKTYSWKIPVTCPWWRSISFSVIPFLGT